MLSDNQNNQLISVVICTYNRSSLLRLCLESLLTQNFDKNLFEIIVVDNNSTDDTVVMFNNFFNGIKNVRIINESSQGLSHARNRGFAEAKGDYVAYLDDDAQAEKNWLSEMAGFIKNNPEIKAFGGPYNRFFLKTPPHWFPDDYGKNILRKENFAINIGKGEWISGSNMVFSRDILRSLGGFNVNLGMNGKKITYGEETDFLLRLNKAGVKIYYVSTMLVKHLVADYKFKLSWLLRASFFSGVSYSRVNIGGSFIKIIFAPFVFLFLGILKSLLIWNIPFKKRIYNSFNRFCFSSGRLLGFLKIF